MDIQAAAASPSALLERRHRSPAQRKQAAAKLAKMLGDAVASAATVGLRHVSADEPGYYRKKRGRGFIVVDDRGRVVKDRRVLKRVQALVIPPAWTDVWICRTDDGHLQARGRDARKRMQYRYHPQFRAVRDAAKYGHMRDFVRALPALRERVARDLACKCLCKDKVVAGIVALIERAHVRVGNDEYTKSNGSYGATTLESRHARVTGVEVRLTYLGKSGKRRDIRFRDRRIANLVKQCKALPGARLFRWKGNGSMKAVTSSDVNAYVHEHAGPLFSAKDFRTWAATIAAAIGLARVPEPTSATARKRVAAEVVKSVAIRLGNTPAVCRKSYVHPLLIERYVGGQLGAHMKRLARITEGKSGLEAKVMQTVEREVFDMLL